MLPETLIYMMVFSGEKFINIRVNVVSIILKLLDGNFYQDIETYQKFINNFLNRISDKSLFINNMINNFNILKFCDFKQETTITVIKF